MGCVRVCEHVYDGEAESVIFEDLPGDWRCPDCGMPESEFIQVK